MISEYRLNVFNLLMYLLISPFFLVCSALHIYNENDD